MERLYCFLMSVCMGVCQFFYMVVSRYSYGVFLLLKLCILTFMICSLAHGVKTRSYEEWNRA